MKQTNILQPTLDRLIVKKPTKNKPPRCGYGQCNYCYCQSYQGNDYTCENCGHNYNAHW
jgi:predicted RNA-binding Zn-ribbon protein involved in translation (DUF1610 family)